MSFYKTTLSQSHDPNNLQFFEAIQFPLTLPAKRVRAAYGREPSDSKAYMYALDAGSGPATLPQV